MSALGRSSRSAIVGLVGTAVLEFALTVVVVRTLGDRRTGAFFSSMAVFMIARTAIQIGPATGLVRIVARHRGRGRSGTVGRLVIVAIVPTVVAAALLALVASIVLLTAVDSVLGSSETANYLGVMVAALPFAVAVDLLVAAARGLGSMGPTTVVAQLGVAVLRLLLVAAAAAAGVGDELLAAAWALPFVLVLVPTAAWVNHLVRAADHSAETGATARDRRELARELWVFAGARGLAAIFQQGVRWIDIPLVAVLASTEAAGIYAIASRLVTAGLIAQRGLGLAIAPQVSRLVGGGHLAAARAQYQAAAAWSIVIAFPLFLLMAAYPESVLGLFGAGARAAADALSIVALASLVTVATGPVGVMMLMEGRLRLNLLNTFVALTLNIGLNVALIPRFGVEGAALAWAASIAYANLAPLVQLWRADGYHPFTRGWAAAIVASTMSYGAVGIAIPSVADLSARTGVVMFLVGGTVVYVAALVWRRRDLHLSTLMSLTRARPSVEDLREVPR